MSDAMDSDKTLRLPSPPTALARVVEAAADPTVGTPELAKLVGSDPSFAVQLLRMVNSSLYSRGGEISSVERAVARLGSRSLRNLALCVAVRNCVGRRELGDFDLARFWEDSLRRAVAGRLIAERLDLPDISPSEAFTAGLLQDLGVLALVRNCAEVAPQWMAAVDQDPGVRRELEMELFGMSHDQLAVEIAQVWRLPDALALPMRYHHCSQNAPQAHRERCRIAERAEALTAVLACDDKRLALGRVRDIFAGDPRFGGNEVDELLAVLGERVSKVAGELGFRVGEQPSLEAILQTANTGLIELNLSYEDLVRQLEHTLAEKKVLEEQLKARNRELEQLSLTDTLTKLSNRRALAGRMSYEIKRVARGGDLAFAVADLDHFKQVNDTWGHEYGDEVLRRISAAMLDAVRDTDMVARIGGEEFGVILPGVSVREVSIACDRILDRVRETVIPCAAGEEHSFTISLGVALLRGPHRGRSSASKVATQLYKTADEALYRSKEAGRDRYTLDGDPVLWLDDAKLAA